MEEGPGQGGPAELVEINCQLLVVAARYPTAHALREGPSFACELFSPTCEEHEC